MRAALLDHHVVVFPNQALSREQQYAFTAHLGEVESHGGGRPGKRHDIAHVTANLDADGNPSDRFAQGANYRWHTDKPYYAVPPALTTLYAVELPPQGGDTEFANTALAYAALPEAMKRRIAGLRVVFQWEHGRRPGYYANDLPPVDHPLVRTHPETGHQGALSRQPRHPHSRPARGRRRGAARRAAEPRDAAGVRLCPPLAAG